MVWKGSRLCPQNLHVCKHSLPCLLNIPCHDFQVAPKTGVFCRGYLSHVVCKVLPLTNSGLRISHSCVDSCTWMPACVLPSATDSGNNSWVLQNKYQYINMNSNIPSTRRTAEIKYPCMWDASTNVRLCNRLWSFFWETPKQEEIIFAKDVSRLYLIIQSFSLM